MSEPRKPITKKMLFVDFNTMLDAADSHYCGLDGLTAQSILRPVADAIKVAQRLIDIAVEKNYLAEEERRRKAIEATIKERRGRIADLESAGGAS